MAPRRELTEDGIETTFGVVSQIRAPFFISLPNSSPDPKNVVGAFYLTHLLMPTLLAGARDAPDRIARVVNTSSATAEVAELEYESLTGETKRNHGALYAQSKLGVAIFARELARRYGEFNIVSNSMHPGQYNLLLNALAELYRRMHCFKSFSHTVRAHSVVLRVSWSLRCGALPVEC